MSGRTQSVVRAAPWARGLGVAVVLLAGCGGSDPSIYSVLRNFDQRNYPKVVEECQALLVRNPEDVQAYRYLIKAARQLGTLEALQAEYAQQREADPASAVLHFAEGYAHVQAREWELALASLQRALELDPQLEYANYVIGWMHFNPLTPYFDEDQGKASWQAETALNAGSLGALQVYRDLGNYYRSLGEFELAREQLRAFRDNAFSEGDRIAARDMLEQLQQRELELVQQKQAADAADADVATLVEYATYLFRWKRQAEAIPYWERAAVLEPDNAQLHNFLGLAHMELLENDAAIAAFERALELQPDFAESHYNLGWLFDAQGNEAEALPHYERYLELQPFSEQAETLRERVEDLHASAAEPANPTG